MHNFTNANGPVFTLSSQGAFARFSTANPGMTFFRYTAQQCTSFAMAWFFEHFDKGASAYLGENLTYTASRNCDIHEQTLIAVDLPGIGNFQYDGSANTLEVVPPIVSSKYDAVHGSGFSVNESACTATDAAGNFKRKGEGAPYYTDGVSMAMFRGVEYQLGGQRMDRHDKHTLYTWHSLNQVNVPYNMLGMEEHGGNNRLKLDSMAFQRKYCPLVFSFCRHPSMGIPLISNMYNNLIVQCDLEPFTALICNYSGPGANGAGSVSTVSDSSRTYLTRKRVREGSHAASIARARDLQDGDQTISAPYTTSDLVKEDFPVSIVSRVFFLGPQERYAFASNAHCQVVEACQRVKHSVTKQTEFTFRTDTLQNACSVMYVVPQYRPQIAANRWFDYGGAHDYIRDRSWPALTSIGFSTNGADVYSSQDQSFYQLVQPYAHHGNSARGDRKIYPLNFGIRANGQGPVQFRGAVNLSRSVNSQAKIGFASNMWGGEGASDWSHATPATTVLDIEFIVWNYNVMCYRGGVGGFKFTQSNNSL